MAARPARPVAAAAGVISAGVALGTGELLAGLSRRVPSLVLAVAGRLVDETPGGVVGWSIATFGASQKTLLVAGIVVASLGVGAVVGTLGRSRFRWAVAAFAGIAFLGAWAATAGSPSPGAGAALPAAGSAGAGLLSLRWLLRTAPVADGTTPAAPGPGAERAGGARPGATAVGRRRFLAAGAAAALWAAVGTAVGRWLRQSREVGATRQDVAARLGTAAPALPAGVEVFDAAFPGISPIITPNEEFYRIDTALYLPPVDLDRWRLRIKGMVDREVELDFDELLAMDRIEEFITLQCVSNAVGGRLVGTALWAGVPLGELLRRAGVPAAATQIVGRSVDYWTAGFPTQVAFDGRPSMVAVAMNGEPLPAQHGFPARLVIPGLYGYVSATKWLTEIELTTWESFDGYWMHRGWAKEGPIKTQSRIDVPRPDSTIPAGRTPIAGVAWAPTRSIDRVEVRVDDGPWETARLSGALSPHAWVQWTYSWEATPGEHRIAVRATDGDGETQTAQRTPPIPSGATGHHTISVEVT